MLPFDSKQTVPGNQSDLTQPADVHSDVKASFEVIAVIAFFVGCAALFSLAAGVL
ncbi:MAG: hypothetical protein HKN43_02555 [Rhodothermales bacterium]|nr:hypothetical protein [Rhodothermales bacterium]